MENYAIYKKVVNGWEFRNYGDLNERTIHNIVTFDIEFGNLDSEYLIIGRWLNIPFTLDVSTAIKTFDLRGFTSVLVYYQWPEIKFQIVADRKDILEFSNLYVDKYIGARQ